jgi:outer membrane receptor protein involved in Fe transport
VRQLGGGNFAEINTVKSTGLEFELNYNPTNYWTMKVTAAQQKAVDSQLSQYMNAFFAEHLSYLQGIQNPVTGENWWNTTIGTSTTGAPGTWYLANISTTLSQASANAGKPRPQTREWRFAGTTNFRLSGITENKWLKRLSVGGTVRWEDKAALGFYGAPPGPDGVIRALDKNRPIFDKTRFYADLLMSYDLRLLNKVRTRLQLNVRNVLEDGRLQPFAYNPDGEAWNHRIIDPRQFILTATFDL